MLIVPFHITILSGLVMRITCYPNHAYHVLRSSFKQIMKPSHGKVDRDIIWKPMKSYSDALINIDGFIPTNCFDWTFYADNMISKSFIPMIHGRCSTSKYQLSQILQMKT